MIGRHGTDCPKVPHIGGGYLHMDDDDKPYDVDGVWYCGRCHGWMGTDAPEAQPLVYKFFCAACGRGFLTAEVCDHHEELCEGKI